MPTQDYGHYFLRRMSTNLLIEDQMFFYYINFITALGRSFLALFVYKNFFSSAKRLILFIQVNNGSLTPLLTYKKHVLSQRSRN